MKSPGGAYLAMAALLLVAVRTPAAARTSANPPAITSVSPSQVYYGPATQVTDVTLTGSGFVNGSQVFFDGTALATTFESATELSAALTANPVEGNVGLVTVANPDGSVSGPRSEEHTSELQ